MRLEHDHVIKLEHLRNGAEQWTCRCGRGGVGTPRVVRASILVHRMESFPLVRQRLQT